MKEDKTDLHLLLAAVLVAASRKAENGSECKNNARILVNFFIFDVPPKNFLYLSRDVGGKK